LSLQILFGKGHGLFGLFYSQSRWFVVKAEQYLSQPDVLADRTVDLRYIATNGRSNRNARRGRTSDPRIGYDRVSLHGIMKGLLADLCHLHRYHGLTDLFGFLLGAGPLSQEDVDSCPAGQQDQQACECT
jgi:hypothetical protein